MVAINLAASISRRSGFPRIDAKNVIAEPNPTVEKLALKGRPCAGDFATQGAGPIRGMFQKSGLFGDDAIIVSGTSVARVDQSGAVTYFTGTVPGYGRVDMDGAINTAGTTAVDEVRITNGDGIYLVTGTTVAPETFPDDAGVTSIMALRGFWFASRADSQIGYIRIPGDGFWQALSAVSAEKQPDALLAIWPLGDLSVFFGAASIEGWQFTGQGTPPVAPVPGQTFDVVGLLTRDAVTSAGGALYFVGSDFGFYELATYPKLLSTPDFAEQVRQTDAASIRLGTITLDQHTFVISRLGNNATVAYDITNGTFIDWTSKGRDYFRPHMFCQVGGRALGGDAETGTIWRLEPDTFSDDGDEVTRVFCGWLPIPSGSTTLDSVSLDIEVGVGLISGQGSDPQIGLSISTDQGKTFTDPEWEPLGAMGEYETRVIWRRLGWFDAPGVLLKWEISDPVSLRVSAARANED